MCSMENYRDNLLSLLLKPAIRFALRNMVTVQDFMKLAKVLYVEQAQHDLQKNGNRASVSRLSVMTGLHRRDVSKICRRVRTPHSSQPLISRILNQWEQDSRYHGSDQKPRPLSAEEFAELVSGVSRDIGHAAVLFHLERIGALERRGDQLQLKGGANFVHHDAEQGVQLLSQDNETLVASVEENLFRPAPTRNLHQRTEFDNIRPEDLGKIRSWIFTQGLEFHKQLRTYLSRYDQDLKPKAGCAGGGKVVVTSFSWTDAR